MTCSEATKSAVKKYRKNNPEKVREWNRRGAARYHDTHREEHLLKMKEYYRRKKLERLQAEKTPIIVRVFFPAV